MKTLNPVRQLEILKETYIDTKMAYELYPWGKNRIRNIVQTIHKYLKEKGIDYSVGKKIYIPKSELLKKYPIDKKALEEYVLMQNKNASLVEKESV